jgi:beta-glucosidase
MSKKLNFPKDFYWGAATASYQVEGNIENNDWAYEAYRGNVPKADEGPGHYTRFKEDFDLIKELGHNSHRLSIEWARIEPHEGEFDKKAIEHYREVLQELKKRGITPFVTLWHFTLPLWVYEKGGIESSNFPFYFERYCGVVSEHLADECDHWATMNEPNVVTSNGFNVGSWPPFKKFRLFKGFKVLNNLKRAHINAYKIIKDKDKDEKCEVGVVKDNIYIHSNKNIFNKIGAKIFRWYWNFYFLNGVKEYIDSIGLNYYFHSYFGKDKPKLDKSDMGWDLYPEGIYHTLIELKRYNVPLFIAEAGIADEEDKFRGQYIKDLVYWSHKAIEDGADVKGFMYWSLMDNFEWALGYDKRFGLIEIDYETKERKIRESAYEYKKICKDNALTLD